MPHRDFPDWPIGDVREVRLIPHAEKSKAESEGYTVEEHGRGHHKQYGCIAHKPFVTLGEAADQVVKDIQRNRRG